MKTFGARPTIAGLPARIAIVYLVLFITATGLYTFLWPRAPYINIGDSAWYMEAARDLSDGSVDNLNNRSPGLPLFLILTGATEHSTRTFWFASLFLHFCGIWLLAQVLYTARLSEKAIISFGVLLLLPRQVENAAILMTENLTQFLLILALTSLIRWFRQGKSRWVIVSALAIAYAGLVRPTYQLFALIIAGCLLLISLLHLTNFQLSKLVKASLILVTASVLIIGGYSSLNYYKFGYFGLTPLLGFNLSSKTVRVVERLPDEYADVREMLVSERDKHLISRGNSHTGRIYIWYVGIEGIQEKTKLSKAEASKYMLRLNLLLIRKAPFEYLMAVGESMVGYWFPNDEGLANMNSRVLQSVWALFHFIMVGLFALQLLVLGGIAIFQTSKRLVATEGKQIIDCSLYRIPVIAYSLSGITLFYTMLITCMVDVGYPRQRSGDALLVLMSFIGFHIWWRSLRDNPGMKRQEQFINNNASAC
jgi:4-amino-4-deoxy-L-arabinose transferase-like glycosyltransferase